jgi:MFS family permease
MPHASTDPTGRTSGAPPTGRIVGALSVAGIVVSVMQTLVVPLVSELPELLDSSTSNTAWVVTATLLGAAISTPILGRLGDMYGKKRIMLVSLAILSFGSVLCALTSSLTVVVAGRALQGLALGLIPLGISVMRDELPPERLGSALALMSSSLGIGGALGVPLAAIIAEQLTWHVLFWGAAVLGLLTLVLVWRVIPESPVRDTGHGRFDFVGAAGLSAGILALLLVISKGGDWGWLTGRTLGLAGGGLVVLLAWGGFELRTASPLVDLRISARRQVLMTNLTSVIAGFAMYSASLVIPQLIQAPTGTGYGFGQSMVVAGLCFSPFGVVMMIASPFAAWISDLRGPKLNLMLGSLTIAVSYALGAVLMAHIWQVILVSSLVGLGVALSYSAMPALILSAVPATETAAANGLNSLMRSIGTSSSAAVTGVVLSHMTMPYNGALVPSQTGFRTAFLIGAAAAALSVGLAAFIPGRRAAAPVTIPPRRGLHVIADDASAADAPDLDAPDVDAVQR